MTSKKTPPTELKWIPGKTQIPLPPKPKQSYFSWFSETARSSSSVKTAYNFMNGFINGLTVAPLSLLYPFSVSAEVSRVEARIWATNLAYLSIALGIDYIHDAVWAHPKDTDSPSKTISRDTCELLLFITVATPFFINNAVHYLSLSTAVRQEKLSHLENLTCENQTYPNRQEHTCPSQTNPNIALLLSEPLSNVGISIGLVLGKIFAADYGMLTSGAFRLGAATLYGSTMIQGRLSTCLEGSRDYVRNHIFSVIGYGTSMLALTEGIAYLLWLKTGRESPLIYDALFSLIYAQFIVHSSFARLDFSRDPYAFHPFSQVHLYFEAFVNKYKKSLTDALQKDSKDSFLINTILPVLQHDLIRYWTTIDLRSLDQALENSSIQLYVELTQPTLMKVIDGISEIPDNTGIVLGKRLQKWGKHIGFKSELTELARTLWEISKRGYFSAEFLDPIRNSINKAAGINAPAIAPVPSKKTKARELDATTGDEIFHDALDHIIKATHTKRTHTYSVSYDASNNSRHDGKKTLTTEKRDNKKPSTVVRTNPNEKGVDIIDEYHGNQGSPTLTI